MSRCQILQWVTLNRLFKKTIHYINNGCEFTAIVFNCVANKRGLEGNSAQNK